MRKYAGAQIDTDEFCSTGCCRAAFGVPLKTDEARGARASARLKERPELAPDLGTVGKAERATRSFVNRRGRP